MLLNTKNKKKKFVFVCLILLTAMAMWVVWGNASVQRSCVTVRSNELPEAFAGFTIAHISDLHNAEFGKNNEKLLRILREESPNIIAFTGDLVDSNHTDIDCALLFVRQAVEIAPCYYVAGNHEAWLGTQYEVLHAELIKMGVVVLQNESVKLEYNGASIQLIGVNDPAFSREGDYLAETILETALSQIQIEVREGYTILLAHRPEHFRVYRDKNIDLVLSGHAHGGQFRLPFIGGVIAPDQGFFPEYDAETYTEQNTTMIVSRGLGNSIIPVRINNRPEIVIIELDRLQT